MKCKDCIFYRKRECKHPKLNISSVFRNKDDNCDLTIINNEGSRRGFTRAKGAA